IGLYGILKAIGVKTSYLFRMMWLQMLMITAMALIISIALSLGFSYIAPAEMPFHLTIMNMTQLAGIFIVIGFIVAKLSGIQIKKSFLKYRRNYSTSKRISLTKKYIADYYSQLATSIEWKHYI